MQFQVPQFLDVEDKIFGPFTFKQFLYLTGGIGMGYLSLRFIPFFGIFIGLLCVGFGAALAFYKFNNKPFIYVIEAAFHYAQSPRLYVWRRKEKPTEDLDLTNFRSTKHQSGILANKNTGSKLSDLTWEIDVEQNEVEMKKVHKEEL